MITAIFQINLEGYQKISLDYWIETKEMTVMIILLLALTDVFSRNSFLVFKNNGF